MSETTRYPGTFDGLTELVRRLRGPDGCPWDREQTSRSMKPYILEECYEVLDAIDAADPAKLAEELGDLVFHIVFQVRLGEDEGRLTEADVFEAVIAKLTRRHPHVFGDETASDAGQVLSRWQAIKKAERGDDQASGMDGVPANMPALAYAQSLQGRAAGEGFDWEDAQGVMDKTIEELDELRRAEGPDEREAELGDVLFSIVNLARWLGVDAEGALRKTDTRFRRRYAAMEDLSRQRGVSFDTLPMDGKDALWREAKGIVG